MERKKMILNVILVVIGIGFVVFLSTVVVPKVLVTLTKAAPATKVSLMDSYLIGEKILAKADGVDSCKVNVYVMDSAGKGIKGRQVMIIGVGEEIVLVSGVDGKTEFDLVSKTEGQFTVEASVDGIPLPRTMKVTFRN
jgi:hypothetical protein